MKRIIEKLAKEFNMQNLTWAIGGSFLLKRYGIENGLKELDIMVSEDSVVEINNIMSNITKRLNVVNNENYQTEYYESYKHDDLIINVICNLKCNFNESFEYSFDKEDISTLEMYNNEEIYFCHLLDWYVIYQEINLVKTSNLIAKYYENGTFLNNERFEEKFAIANLSQIKDNYIGLKNRIYHIG